MVSGYTLFSTFAVHHLVIGVSLFLVLSVILRLTKVSAEIKSWLWLTAFLASTLVPFISFVPDTKVEVKVNTIVEPASFDNGFIVSPKVQVTTQSGNDAAQWNVPESWIHESIWLLSLFILVWVMGSLWRTVSVIRSFIHTHRVKQDVEYLPHFKQGQYPVAVSHNTSSPMVIGLLKPVVILPANIVNALKPEQIKPIIMHEVAHIKRGDLWFSLMQELLAIVFWWSPVMRSINHRIHINRELACDYRAIKALNSPKCYAQSLLECAKLMVLGKQNLLAVGLFSKKKELAARVDAALVSNQNRPFRPLYALVSCALLTVTTISVAQNFAPKVNVDDVVKRSKHYALLSRQEGEALINAVSREDIETLEFLVSVKGIDIDTPAIGDGTALIIAVREDSMKMVDALIDMGADVNQSSRGDGNPLIVAAMNNNLRMAKRLLDYGADVNAVVIDDESALINASRRGSLEMTKLLVEHGADVNLKVRTRMVDGGVVRSPLNMARNKAVRDYLLSHGATP